MEINKGLSGGIHLLQQVQRETSDVLVMRHPQAGVRAVHYDAGKPAR